VIISEAAYPHDTPGIQGQPMKDYSFSKAGQTAWLTDQLRYLSSNTNVAGFFYFYPEYFPGMSGDANTLNLQSSGLFSNDTQSLPAMSAFRQNL